MGISPMGDINPFDVWDTILFQYANSPILTKLITNLAAYFDFTKNFDDFFDLIWNVYTAQGYGLDVWGNIVGVTRVLNIAIVGNYLGFAEASPTAETFGFGPFYSGETLTTNFSLSDPAFRILILAKAAANITDGSILSLNALLLSLFPNRGDAFVTDDGNMQMSYTFNFALTPVEAAIVTQSGVLPQPAGVTVNYVQNF